MGEITDNCDIVGTSESRQVRQLDEQNPHTGIAIEFK
jgi:hypothetical protein